MKYLLDTHAIIWCIDKQVSKLSPKAREIILNPRNTIYISVASLWEIAIKSNLGKLDLSVDFLLNELEQSEFGLLQIKNSYLRGLETLPQIHKDPFDRLIISTAQAEGATLLTADENIQEYDIKWAW